MVEVSSKLNNVLFVVLVSITDLTFPFQRFQTFIHLQSMGAVGGPGNLNPNVTRDENE